MTTNTLTSPNLEALSPTIDLDKVKVMLTDLDHDIPNNAKSLLRAMEAFQKVRFIVNVFLYCLNCFINNVIICIRTFLEVNYKNKLSL